MRKGYLMITLTRDKKPKTYAIHRLLATAFISEPKDGQEINHKNGIKTDNRIGNLEWCTKQENLRHSWNNGFHPSGKAHPQSKRVIQLTLKNEYFAEYGSVGEAHRKTGYLASRISEVCRGEKRTYKGYKWVYKDSKFYLNLNMR